MSSLKKGEHAINGGSWEDAPFFCKKVHRYWPGDGASRPCLSFRVVKRTPEHQTVSRGGSWRGPHWAASVAYRTDLFPQTISRSTLGLRVVKRNHTDKRTICGAGAWLSRMKGRCAEQQYWFPEQSKNIQVGFRILRRTS